VYVHVCVCVHVYVCVCVCVCVYQESALQDSGELLAKEEIAPSILLNPNATLSPADFERKWLSMKIRYYLCVKINVT